MKYLDLKTNLNDFTIFSLQDMKKIDGGFHRRRLNNWQDKGYIKKVIRGYYVFSDLEIDEGILFCIANRIYYPSYISFEMALSYYNFIPENIYKVTSASTKKTYGFKTSVAEFNYRTIKPELFFGYELIGHDGKQFKIASAEKAVLDYFYNNPGLKTEADFESLRFNREVFLDKIKIGKLREFLGKFSQKALTRRVNSFMEYIRNA